MGREEKDVNQPISRSSRFPFTLEELLKRRKIPTEKSSETSFGKNQLVRQCDISGKNAVAMNERSNGSSRGTT